MKINSCMLIFIILIIICSSPLLMFLTRLIQEDRITLAVSVICVFVVMSFVIFYSMMVKKSLETEEEEEGRGATMSRRDDSMHRWTIIMRQNDEKTFREAPPPYDAVIEMPPSYDQLKNFKFFNQSSFSLLPYTNIGNSTDDEAKLTSLASSNSSPASSSSTSSSHSPSSSDSSVYSSASSVYSSASSSINSIPIEDTRRENVRRLPSVSTIEGLYVVNPHFAQYAPLHQAYAINMKNTLASIHNPNNNNR